MTPEEKIQKAQERIKELNILISHWDKSTMNIHSKELKIIESNDNFLAA